MPTIPPSKIRSSLTWKHDNLSTKHRKFNQCFFYHPSLSSDGWLPFVKHFLVARSYSFRSYFVRILLYIQKKIKKSVISLTRTPYPADKFNIAKVKKFLIKNVNAAQQKLLTQILFIFFKYVINKENVKIKHFLNR